MQLQLSSLRELQVEDEAPQNSLDTIITVPFTLRPGLFWPTQSNISGPYDCRLSGHLSHHDWLNALKDANREISKHALIHAINLLIMVGLLSPLASVAVFIVIACLENHDWGYVAIAPGVGVLCLMCVVALNSAYQTIIAKALLVELAVRLEPDSDLEEKIEENRYIEKENDTEYLIDEQRDAENMAEKESEAETEIKLAKKEENSWDYNKPGVLLDFVFHQKKASLVFTLPRSCGDIGANSSFDDANIPLISLLSDPNPTVDSIVDIKDVTLAATSTESVRC